MPWASLGVDPLTDYGFLRNVGGLHGFLCEEKFKGFVTSVKIGKENSRNVILLIPSYWKLKGIICREKCMIY